MSQEAFPSGVLTFLFSDIQGSTPLWEKDPAGMSEALEQHNAVLHEAIAAYDGCVFKIIGDEFQAMFHTSDQAIRAAIDGQRKLANTVWGHIGPLRVRMGIHTGSAQWEGHDFAVSHTFNRTARIMSCGHGGQILISAEAKAALGAELPPAVSLQDMGRVRLKGLTEREHLYQVNAPDLVQAFPPLKTISGSAPSGAHNLPEPATPFIGRQQELRELGQLLGSDGTRLVTITGAGGMGKTRLALEFAWRRRGQYASGVHFISLAPLSAPDQILPVTAKVVGLQFKGDREPQDQLLRYMKSRQALLIFDNFEHLRQGAGLLTRVLEAAPQVELLATSRERLGVSSECLFALGGLALPVNGESLERVPVADAVRMFQTYARRVRPDYELDHVDWPVIVQLCQLVEGMPLAIELAAAWTRSLSTAEILAELRADLQILERESPDVPARQRSMQASFDYSWRLLSAEERQVLMKLSVFRGGCSREAAREVAGGTPHTLGSLMDKSMLLRERESGRYQIHELLRQMAEQRLQESGVAENIVYAHATYFLKTVEEASEGAVDEASQAARDRMISLEMDNIRIVIKRSSNAENAAIALKLAVLMEERPDLLWREKMAWFQDALQAGSGNLPPALEAQGRLQLAWKALQNDIRTLGRDHWIGVASRALSLYEQLGDARGTAEALYTLGFAYFGNDFQMANAYYAQATACFKELGEDHIGCLLQRAWIHVFEGYLSEARAINRQAMSVAHKTGNELLEATVTCRLAQIAFYEGNLQEARDQIEDVLSFRTSQGRPATPYTRNLAMMVKVNIALAEQDGEAAREPIAGWLEFARKIEWFTGGMFIFHKVAMWLRLCGRNRQAAYFMGVFQQLRDGEEQPLEKIEQPIYRCLQNSVRTALGVEQYNAAYQEGYHAPAEEAFDLALELIINSHQQEI
jgi:predicted ATPase/class 3 adenylate cyclase